MKHGIAHAILELAKYFGVEQEVDTISWILLGVIGLIVFVAVQRGK